MGPSAADDDGKFTYCVGSPTWNPSRYIADSELHARAAAHLERDDFYSAIAASFSLPSASPPPPPAPPSDDNDDNKKKQDTYVYHAIMSVTLAQAQHAVSLGRGNGGRGTLHAWYRDPSVAEAAPPRPHPNPPTRQDVDAYLAIFDAATATPAALRGFAANARKGSVRAAVADHLLAKRYLHPALPALQIPKVKPGKGAKAKGTDPAKDPYNPYLDLAAWSCRNLEWCGPCGLSEAAPGAAAGHPVLPVLMHHFGCACPSREALEILRVLAAGRGVVDAGSGGGYWTFMLRRHGVDVTAVDSGQSAWRTTWVRNTVVDDAARWLRRQRAPGCPDRVLLVVYPIGGGGVAGALLLALGLDDGLEVAHDAVGAEQLQVVGLGLGVGAGGDLHGVGGDGAAEPRAPVVQQQQFIPPIQHVLGQRAVLRGWIPESRAALQEDEVGPLRCILGRLRGLDDGLLKLDGAPGEEPDCL